MGMKSIGTKFSKIAAFFILAWAALAFNDEFLKLDLVVEGMLWGLEMAVIFILIYYFSQKPQLDTALQGRSFNSSRVAKIICIGMLLVLSPFIFIFGMAFLSDLLSKGGF
jgi:hypothetical protein